MRDFTRAMLPNLPATLQVHPLHIALYRIFCHYNLHCIKVVSSQQLIDMVMDHVTIVTTCQ